MTDLLRVGVFWFFFKMQSEDGHAARLKGHHRERPGELPHVGTCLSRLPAEQEGITTISERVGRAAQYLPVGAGLLWFALVRRLGRQVSASPLKLEIGRAILPLHFSYGERDKHLQMGADQK